MALDYTQSDYYKNLAANTADSEEEKARKAAARQDVEKQAFQQKYGGMGEASLGDFQTLLGRLEASKIRQQQAKDVSARPNIYAQGLAQMMSNF